MLHEFADDFYGSELCICITGYIRDEMKFDSLGMQWFVKEVGTRPVEPSRMHIYITDNGMYDFTHCKGCVL